jgi:membrane associated rhomboid family serine protease
MLPIYGTQPLRRFPWITLLLILLNAAVFLAWQGRVGLENSVAIAGLIPSELGHEPDAILHLFASMFLHGGWMHLLGNLWFLWLFGRNVEDKSGPRHFLYFYLICGVIAALAQIAVAPRSHVPMIGASGAISGVMGAYFLLFPKSRIATAFFIFVFEIPSWVFLFLWIGFQVINQQAEAASPAHSVGGVAYMAHIGGFLAGLILIRFFRL